MVSVVPSSVPPSPVPPFGNSAAPPAAAFSFSLFAGSVPPPRWEFSRWVAEAMASAAIVLGDLAPADMGLGAAAVGLVGAAAVVMVKNNESRNGGARK